VDLIDSLNQLAARIRRQKDSVHTEEAAKTAFILPFLQALGYDVFNPSEVIPELTADHGVKKGEKVDYGIKLDGKIVLLIECKPVGSDLEAKYAGQLYRYFSVTDARFGVLTDGIRYLFFSDIEKQNKMDDRPFFEFNIIGFDDNHIEELKKFTRSAFDLDTILGTASNLKYHRALVSEIESEFDSPSEEFIKIFASRVYPGRFTQAVKEQFTILTDNALKDFVRSRVNKRLKTALETDKLEQSTLSESTIGIDNKTEEKDAIETTPEEMKAYRIVQAIGAEIADPSRIVIRDAKSYCAILWDNNNRRPICRLHFGKNRNLISIFTPNGEVKIELERIINIYQHKTEIKSAVEQYQYLSSG